VFGGYFITSSFKCTVISGHLLAAETVWGVYVESWIGTHWRLEIGVARIFIGGPILLQGCLSPKIRTQTPLPLFWSDV